MCGEPFDRGNGCISRDDFDDGGVDFFPGLRGIAAIGEHARGAAGDGEGGTGAGESAEIAQIGQVRDKQAGEPGTRHFAAQCGDAAGVVHGGSFIMAGFGEQFTDRSSQFVVRDCMNCFNGRLKSMGSQFAKPRGWLGRLILRRMNLSHSTVTDWGFSHIEIPRHGCILDAGCGGGRTIGKLAAQSGKARVYGLDHSPDSVAMASALNADLIDAGRVEVVEGSVSHMPYASDMFDLVTAVETHFFWPNLDGDVREVLRVVKPGGVFAVIAEVYRGAPAMASKAMEKQSPKMGLKLLTAEEHIDMLWNAGFADVKAYTVPEKGWVCVVGTKPEN